MRTCNFGDGFKTVTNVLFNHLENLSRRSAVPGTAQSKWALFAGTISRAQEGLRDRRGAAISRSESPQCRSARTGPGTPAGFLGIVVIRRSQCHGAADSVALPSLRPADYSCKEPICFAPFLALPGAMEGTPTGFLGIVVIPSARSRRHGGRAALLAPC
jgi:hypothetical protein